MRRTLASVVFTAASLLALVLLVAPRGADAHVVELTNEEFFQSVAYPSKDTEKFKVTLVLWYIDACVSCRELKHSMRDLTKHMDALGDKARKRVFIARINAARFPTLARKEGIVSFPTFKMYSSIRDQPLVFKDDPSSENLIDLIHGEYKRLLQREKQDSEEREGL
jgi:hypothetical protein